MKYKFISLDNDKAIRMMVTDIESINEGDIVIFRHKDKLSTLEVEAYRNRYEGSCMGCYINHLIMTESDNYEICELGKLCNKVILLLYENESIILTDDELTELKYEFPIIAPFCNSDSMITLRMIRDEYCNSDSCFFYTDDYHCNILSFNNTPSSISSDLCMVKKIIKRRKKYKREEEIKVIGDDIGIEI